MRPAISPRPVGPGSRLELSGLGDSRLAPFSAVVILHFNKKKQRFFQILPAHCIEWNQFDRMWSGVSPSTYLDTDIPYVGPSVMESLLRFLPSSEDMASLRLLKDEYDELCTAEQFAFEVRLFLAL